MTEYVFNGSYAIGSQHLYYMMMRSAQSILNRICIQGDEIADLTPRDYLYRLYDEINPLFRSTVFPCGQDYLEYYREWNETLEKLTCAKGELQELSLKNNIRLDLNMEVINFPVKTLEQPPISSPFFSSFMQTPQPKPIDYAYVIEAHQVVVNTESRYCQAIEILKKINEDETFAGNMLEEYLKTMSAEHHHYAEMLYNLRFSTMTPHMVENQIRNLMAHNTIAKYSDLYPDELPSFAACIVHDEECSFFDLQSFIIYQKVLKRAGVLDDPLRWLKERYKAMEDNIRNFVSAAFNFCIAKYKLKKTVAVIYDWLDGNDYVDNEKQGRYSSFIMFFKKATGVKECATKTLQDGLSELKKDDDKEYQVSLNCFAQGFFLMEAIA